MKTTEGTKRIVVCADDVGMHPGIEMAVLQLAEIGRLGAASCLVDGVSFSRNAQALDLSGLQIGLHLNFTARPNPDRDQTMLYLPVSLPIARRYITHPNK